MVRTSIAFKDRALCDGKQMQVTDALQAALLRSTADLLGKKDLDRQSLRRGVLGSDGSTVSANDAVGDSETEARTAGLAVAGDCNAIERTEDVGEFGVGQAWAVVSNFDASE